jgi:hypothetical protein
MNALTDDQIKDIANSNGHPADGVYVGFLEQDVISFAQALLRAAGAAPCTERELAMLRMGLRSLRKEFSEKLRDYPLKPPVTDNDMEVVEHFKRDISEIDALIAKCSTAHQLQQSSKALQAVSAERRRQIEAEGYDPRHDDEHVCGEIAAYAAFYAMPPAARDWPATETGYGATWGEAIVPEGWAPPKTGDRHRELVKAAALIIAEIERLDRADIARAGQ